MNKKVKKNNLRGWIANSLLLSCFVTYIVSFVAIVLKSNFLNNNILIFNLSTLIISLVISITLSYFFVKKKYNYKLDVATGLLGYSSVIALLLYQYAEKLYVTYFLNSALTSILGHFIIFLISLLIVKNEIKKYRLLNK